MPKKITKKPSNKSAFKVFLIGLLLWHGASVAISKPQFLSGLRDMGLLGFQHGTILKQDIGERSFIDAVEQGDVHLLQKRIHDRLKGPFVDFMKDLHAVDEKGRNVFHALAEAKRDQKHFADIMESLIHISGFHIEAQSRDAERIEAANAVISPEAQLEKTPLIQAVKKARSHTAVLKEVEKFIAENTAVTVISYLHGKTSPKSIRGKRVYQQTFLELLLTRNPNLRCKPDCRLLEGVDIHKPHFMEDSQGFFADRHCEKERKSSGFLPYVQLSKYAPLFVFCHGGFRRACRRRACNGGCGPRR